MKIKKKITGIAMSAACLLNVLHGDASLIANAVYESTEITWLKGDANGDGFVNIRDAAIIAKKVAQRKTNELPACADYNDDGCVNIRDAAAIACDFTHREGDSSLSGSGSSNDSLGNETISLLSDMGRPGDTVTLYVDIACNNNFESLDAAVTWDDASLTADSVSSGSKLVNVASSESENYCTVVAYGSDPISDGIIAAIDFTIPADAEPGTVYNINFSDINTFAVFDGPDIADSVYLKGGSITVVEPSVFGTHHIMEEGNEYIVITDYDKSETKAVIPDTMYGLPVKAIGDNAFADCSRLESVEIPISVTSIGNRAFENCTSLEDITIKNPDCRIYDDKSTISNGLIDGYGYYFDGTIYCYKRTNAQAYAEKYGYKFESLGENPKIMLSDIVSLKKWLVGSGELSESQTAKYDLNNDGKLNVFDWIICKRIILNRIK